MTDKRKDKAIKKAKEKKNKQEYKPWPKADKKNIEHTLLEMENSKLKKDQEIERLKQGMKTVDKEVQTSIDRAEMELKAAKIKLNSLRFDKAHNITHKRLLFQLEESKRESQKHQRNMDALQEQLERGKPIQEETKMPEEKEKESEEEEQE